jgi:hypothetical protein
MNPNNVRAIAIAGTGMARKNFIKKSIANRYTETALGLLVMTEAKKFQMLQLSEAIA